MRDGLPRTGERGRPAADDSRSVRLRDVDPVRLRDRAWLVLLVAGLSLAALYPLIGSPAARSGALAVLDSVVVAAVLAGLVWYRPRRWQPWALVVAHQALWGVGNVFWTLEIARTGSAPSADSWIQAAYLAGDVLLIAVLAIALLARDRDAAAFVEAAILAAAGASVVWITIAHRYFDLSDPTYLSSAGVAVVLGYVLIDVVGSALALRLLAAGRVGVPLGLLAASALALAASDMAWNWLTVASTYVPGSWADLGWLLASLLGGVAALHPRMASAFEPADAGSHDAVGRGRVALLAGASVVPAATLAYAALAVDGDADDYLGLSIAMGIVALLVLSRLVVAARAAERSARALAERNDQLLELDQLKDDFVASVSHELRTPLTSIRGYSELLLEGDAGELNDDQREYLEIVDRNVGRLLGLVGDLLDAAQARRGQLTLEPSPCDLASIAFDAVERARPAAAARGLELSFAAEPLPAVDGDVSRLGQVLDNLLSNAVKFTPPNGHVAVRARRDDRAVVVEVRDDGMGIAADELPRLFERFFRTTSATEGAIQGTGLGLAITRAIVEAHGGALAVTSEPGAGSVFSVRLPLGVPAARRELAA